MISTPLESPDSQLFNAANIIEHGKTFVEFCSCLGDAITFCCFCELLRNDSTLISRGLISRGWPLLNTTTTNRNTSTNTGGAGKENMSNAPPPKKNVYWFKLLNHAHWLKLKRGPV